MIAGLFLVVAVIVGNISSTREEYVSYVGDVSVNCGSAWSPNSAGPWDLQSECTSTRTAQTGWSSFLILVGLAFVVAAGLTALPSPSTGVPITSPRGVSGHPPPR